MTRTFMFSASKSTCQEFLGYLGLINSVLPNQPRFHCFCIACDWDVRIIFSSGGRSRCWMLPNRAGWSPSKMTWCLTCSLASSVTRTPTPPLLLSPPKRVKRLLLLLRWCRCSPKASPRATTGPSAPLPPSAAAIPVHARGLASSQTPQRFSTPLLPMVLLAKGLEAHRALPPHLPCPGPSLLKQATTAPAAGPRTPRVARGAAVGPSRWRCAKLAVVWRWCAPRRPPAQLGRASCAV